MSERRIYTVEAVNTRKFGMIYRAFCPDCNEQIVEAPNSRKFDHVTCKCGRKWSFTCHASYSEVSK